MTAAKMFKCYKDWNEDWVVCPGEDVVCHDGLKEWFDVPDTAETLWVRVRTAKGSGKRRSNEIEAEYKEYYHLNLVSLRGIRHATEVWNDLALAVKAVGGHSYIGFWYKQ